MVTHTFMAVVRKMLIALNRDWKSYGKHACLSRHCRGVACDTMSRRDEIR